LVRGVPTRTVGGHLGPVARLRVAVGLRCHVGRAGRVIDGPRRRADPSPQQGTRGRVMPGPGGDGRAGARPDPGAIQGAAGGGGEQEMETGDATATAGQDNVLNSSTCGCERGGRHSRTINVGLVTGNNVAALANTGLNSQEGGVDGVDAESENHHRHHRQETEQELETGDADAFAWQTNVINSSVGEGEEE